MLQKVAGGKRKRKTCGNGCKKAGGTNKKTGGKGCKKATKKVPVKKLAKVALAKCKAGAKKAVCKKAKKAIKDDEDEVKTPARSDPDEMQTPPKKRSSARRRCYSSAYHSTETMLKDVPDVDIKEIAKEAARNAVKKFVEMSARA